MKSIPEFKISNLILIISSAFAIIPDSRNRKVRFSLKNTLMAVGAMFSLKFRSLLEFDQPRDNKAACYNIEKLFGVKKIPSDSWVRELLDKVNPKSLENAYRALHHHVKQWGGLELYHYLDDYLLISTDGSGYFCSNKIHCPPCNVKTRSNGKVEYHHYLLTSVIVHPNLSQGLALPPEFILRGDGNTKNDCATNALKRMIIRIREFYPTQKIIILLDSLYATGPIIKLLKENNINFIIVLKENNHQALFEIVQKNLRDGNMDEFEIQENPSKYRLLRGYRYINGVPLNKSHPDILVNYLDYWEVVKDKESEKTGYQCLWITDLLLSRENVEKISTAGRARWKVENETFNTLKTGGYELEHNYGHGQEYLSSMMVTLMMLSFLMDQIQELGCSLFKEARRRYRSRLSLWARLRAFFTTYLIDTWEILLEAIVKGYRLAKLEVNDST
jgi:hypothetical protein